MSDGGESPRHSTAWVMVQVLDQNDNQPVFLQQIYRVKVPERERRRKGDAVFRVSAFDPDEGSNARLSYSIVDGNQEGKFSIDARTGVVFLRKALAAGNYDILTVSAPSTVVRSLQVEEKNGVVFLGENLMREQKQN